MNDYRKLLEDVRDLKLHKDDLPEISYDQEVDLLNNPIVITRQSLIAILKRYKQERLTLVGLYNWIYFIWFSDFYSCYDQDADSIVSVVGVLEELEGEEEEMTLDDIDYCLNALEKNEVAESLLGEDL